MSKAKPTPGPWEASRDEVFCRVDGRQEWIAHLNDADFRYDVLSEEEAEEEQAANARLIAAAPELLEAAKEVCRLAGRDGVNTSLAKAITKAEGRK